MSAADSAAANPAAAASGRPGPVTVPPFAVISGGQVQHALQGRERQITELVEDTYRLHSAGDSVNPPSVLPALPRPAVGPDHRAARLDRRAAAGRWP